MDSHFTHCIIRKPGKSLVKGISNANLGIPNYELAVSQHEAYKSGLIKAGCQVIELPALEEFPDACFVEDTAVVNEKCAVISRPARKARRGEELHILPILENFYNPKDQIFKIQSPGTLEGGDIMRIGSTYYIGLSDRTNEIGATQFADFMQKFGFDTCFIELHEMLHLKTGVNYLGNERIIVAGEFQNNPEFIHFDQILIPPEEAYSANSLRVNDVILIPQGFPAIKQELLHRNLPFIEIKVSEFQKLDGGLSCLSLRFTPPK